LIVAMSACVAEEQPISETAQAASSSPQIPGAIGDVISFAKDGIAIFNGISAPLTIIEKVLQYLGLLPSAPSVAAEFAALSAQLNQVAGNLSWEIAEVDRENLIANAVGSAIGAGEWLQQTGNAPLPASSDTAQGSLNAVTALEQPIQFQRYYTDAVFTPWGSVIPDRPTQTNGFVYDWRLGLPAMMEAIAMRLQVMAAENPSFKTASTMQSELMLHRAAILGQVPTMTAGVRCNVKTSWVSGTVFAATLGSTVRCADINSGAYAGQDFTWPTVDMSSCLKLVFNGNVWTTVIDQTCVASFANAMQTQKWATISGAMDMLRRNVLLQMPLFGMQATADMLYMFANPQQPELTAKYARIPIAANTGLCLDVVGANPTSGTPVQLWTCNASAAQHWVYDRTAQTVTNPVLGKCLDVRGGDPTPGAAVQIWDCNGTLAQKWSYDPTTGALVNALGNVLDVENGTIASGTPVWTWPRNGTAAQKWYADPNLVVVQL
jgi:hypothetical protein